MSDRLSGIRVLIFETREQARFSRLLTEQGADVLQCPMFSIMDAPNPEPVEAWIERVIEAPPDDLVLMTGEGLRRIIKVTQRMGNDQAFITAAGRCKTFARGPKPGRALREIGLEVQVTSDEPTSEGVANTLARYDLHAHRVALQLYPGKDHNALVAQIEAQGAQVDIILPYVYDASATEGSIVRAIEEMSQARIHVIALTSSGQVRRLVEVARLHRCEDRLRAGLEHTLVASVGPVVSDELKSYGLRTDISPPGGAFFLKPLISAIMGELSKNPSKTSSQAPVAKRTDAERD